MLQDDRVRQYENYMNLEEQVNKNKEKLEGEITAVAQVHRMGFSVVTSF